MTTTAIRTETTAPYAAPIQRAGNLADDAIVARALEILEARIVASQIVVEREAFTRPGIVCDYLKLRLAPLEREEFHILHLTNDHRLIADECHTVGTLDSASVYPRDVLKSVLKHNAAAVILAHNHPSGNPDPSHADRRITDRLKNVLAMVDVRVLDHVIVASSGETASFAELGYI